MAVPPSAARTPWKRPAGRNSPRRRCAAASAAAHLMRELPRGALVLSLFGVRPGVLDAASNPMADLPEPGQLAETPDVYGAFPRLSEAQIEALAAHGHRRPTHPGEVLFREGDPSCDFFVILAGKVAIVTGYGGDEHVISVHGPGRFLGELSLLTGQTVFVTAVIREPGEVLVVPVERLRHLVTLSPWTRCSGT